MGRRTGKVMWCINSSLLYFQMNNERKDKLIMRRHIPLWHFPACPVGCWAAQQCLTREISAPARDQRGRKGTAHLGHTWSKLNCLWGPSKPTIVCLMKAGVFCRLSWIIGLLVAAPSAVQIQVPKVLITHFKPQVSNIQVMWGHATAMHIACHSNCSSIGISIMH